MIRSALLAAAGATLICVSPTLAQTMAPARPGAPFVWC